jgi:integrase
MGPGPSAPLVELVRTDILADIAPEVARLQEFIRSATAENTWRGYRSDWEHFTTWCVAHGRSALPAEPATIALYLAGNADLLRVATLQRRLAAISRAHRAIGLASPTSMSNPIVSETWKGIRRSKGVAQTGKAALLTADLRQMLAAIPSGLIGIRDRALLLLGFAGAFRRSELVALNVEDLDFREEGLVIGLRRSKTDQEGQGREVGIPYGSDPSTCPYRNTRAWLRASAIEQGSLFRRVDRHGRIGPERLSDKGVALIVKRYAAAIGRDASQFAGHSLRAGLVTSAAMAGASERSIMAQTGHRSVGMVRRYVRSCSLFQDNAAAKTGL